MIVGIVILPPNAGKYPPPKVLTERLRELERGFHLSRFVHVQAIQD
jgi:hypothetical protein